ncbi:Putative transposase [Xenorhabdus poinarii G6]|uniref:Putative transposase n=1 Tax=Xenorhabdus poinarii G6 TaxID=1354304 RepID=A0A068R620_9GAMM|nr:Putative transposase [Xenorhabdus poinarii G6]
MIRNNLRYVSLERRESGGKRFEIDLTPAEEVVLQAFTEQWDECYPQISRASYDGSIYD